MAEWTKVPPTKPGFYWTSFTPSSGRVLNIAELNEDGWLELGADIDAFGREPHLGIDTEYWPERIEPPKEG